MQYVLIALAAYLSKSISFKVKGRTVTINATGTGPVHFSFASALAAAEQAVLLPSVPATIVIGSTNVSVS
jgi:hypothetical protein